MECELFFGWLLASLVGTWWFWLRPRGVLAVFALLLAALAINAVDERPSPEALALLQPSENRNQIAIPPVAPHPADRRFSVQIWTESRG